MSSIAYTLRGASTLLGSTLALYTLVAACSVSVGSGGTVGETVGSFADVMTHPLGDAKAEVVTSGSRLKATFIAGADGSKRVDPHLFWDSERNENCRFTETATGDLYCLPAYHNDVALYSTGYRVWTQRDCSGSAVALPGIYTPGPCESTDRIKYAASSESDGCATSARKPTRMFRASNVSYDLRSYQASGGVCTNDSGFSRVYALGEEIPLSAFVKGTAGHE